MDSARWRRCIVEMVNIKYTIYTLDHGSIYEYHLPEVAATETELAAVEKRLGEPLPPHYRAFLQHANGWRAFWHSADLFGTRDLLNSPRFQQAVALLRRLEENILYKSGIRQQDILPIAAQTKDVDLFVIGRPSSPIPGIVIWFAADEIQRFPNFDEYFLAMMDYNRLRVQRLQQGG